MQSIFNSLGSNYSIRFISTSLWSIVFSQKSDLNRLETHLLKTYKGVEVLSLYKGRDAIEASLRVLLPQGSKVLTQAFSCYAIEEGIVRAGMKPVYVDISSDSTNFSIAQLDSALQKNPTAQAVLIQHSLGVPAESVAISAWCKKHKLVLLEDVAQGIGGYDENGALLGSHADAVIFSFGRDKIVDAVSGGAVVFKQLDAEKTERLLAVKEIITRTPFYIVYEDLLYPDITSVIRKTHHLGIGKLIFIVCKMFGLLGSPIKSKTDKMTWMHPAYAKLALLQFKGLEAQINQRKKMAQEYIKQLEGSGLDCLINKRIVQRSSNLRFSIRCKSLEQVAKLIAALQRNRVYVSDRWYRKPVDCGSFACKTAYTKGSCPNAEALSEQVLNLPTHREMNIRKVQKICNILVENV